MWLFFSFRSAFLAAHIPLFLYPFLHTVSKTRPFEYLRLTSLGVIGKLLGSILMPTVCVWYYILLFILLHSLLSWFSVSHETRAVTGVPKSLTSLCWPLTTLLSSGLSGLLSWKYSTAFWILAMLPRYSSSLPVGLERRKVLLAWAERRTKRMVFGKGRRELTHGTLDSNIFYSSLPRPTATGPRGIRNVTFWP